MTLENRYTDEEVINALECCGEVDRKYCDTCTYRSESDCIIAMARNALDLIKRQKADIAYWQDAAANAKREAVKEFADRLRERLLAGGIYPVIVKNQIEKLVKEMMEEEK